MSEFVRHIGCSNCGSSDALGEFSDGHYWCFSCGYYIPPVSTNIEIVKNTILKEEKLSFNSLPQDCSNNYSEEAWRWLKKYGLTDKEIYDNILWSDSYGLLVFPFYGEEKTLLCWQGRWFPARKPKVYTAGYPDKHLLIRSVLPNCNSIVVVEDSVSAIKVSRVCDSSELLGSNLSMHKAVGLSRIYDNLIIWLDSDKLKTALKFKEKYSLLFKNVSVVHTEKDPKEYSTDEIRKELK